MKSPLLATAALFGLSLALPLRADNPVLYWNQKILDATRLSRVPPPMASLLFANYHVAIFDAVNGIDHRYHSWSGDEAAPAGAEVDAAIAGAAHAVMSAQWSQIVASRVIELDFQDAVARIPDGPGKAAGLAWGKHIAQKVLAQRASCGFDKPIPGKYASNEPGKWRETPPQFRPPTLPFWGGVKPFVMTSCSQFRAPPPPPLDSAEYAEQVAYVARVGPRDNAQRTEYQTLCTPFWADDLGSCTPPGHWNWIAAEIARARHVGTAESARLFALLALAEADSAISCWETKFYYRNWRPETAIREMNAALNSHFKSDPTFIPNLASPSFPAYTSGHSTFSAAGTHLLARFFGTDDIEFTAASDGLPGVTHHFRKLSDATVEAGMSRVWGGIHTMADNVEGQKAGRAIADYVLDHALLPAG